MEKTFKIAIADDNRMLIQAIKDKLSFFDDIQVLYATDNGEEMVHEIGTDTQPDIILMDIEMPVMNGIEATSAIKAKYPRIKIIMLTVFDNDEYIFSAIKAGADGYLLKDTDPQSLYNGILQTMEGGAAMNPSIAMRTLELLRNPPESPELSGEADEIKLTGREIEVLEQLSKGHNYTVIAEKLFVSPSTIRKHIENIYKKLQVHSKLEAVDLARRKKLI